MASAGRPSHQRRERQIQNRRSPEVTFGRVAADELRSGACRAREAEKLEERLDTNQLVE